MAKHIILAQSKPTADALAAYLVLAKGQYRETESLEEGRKPDVIIWEDAVPDLEAYRVLADEIEVKASTVDDQIPVGDVVILVDQVNLKRLDPVMPGVWEWDGVIAMLILTFPEIRWVFGVMRGAGDQEQDIVRDHGLLSLLAAGADPLFDGTGLREWVRRQARQDDKNATNDRPTSDRPRHLPKRSQVAVAIDDERSYAYFHSYVAYRFGFRAFPVTDENLMEELLGEHGSLKGSPQLRLSIEDLFLNFPDRCDRHLNTRWSDLQVRSQNLPALDGSNVLRMFVTSGQKKGTDEDRLERNRNFREILHEEERLGTMLYKPISGVFDLWKDSGLMSLLCDGRQPGQADGFVWPPHFPDFPESDQNHDHSAPGRLLEIATRLEARAERLLGNVHCAIRAVQGAVLAVEAMELLGEKAQTTFLEALALKHEFETIAECQFYGVQSRFDVRSRMRDVRLEVRELGRYFNQKKRKEAEWNAEAAILNCLIRTYQEYNQFDEELDVQIQNRVIHRRLWFKKRMLIAGDQLRWLNPFYWTACYVHGLLKSVPLFLLALVLWTGGLTFLFSATSPDKSTGLREGLYRGVEDAVTAFFSIGSPTHHGDTNQPSPAKSTSLSQARPTNLTEHFARIEQRLLVLETNTAAIHEKVHELQYPAGYVGVICLAVVAGFIHIGIFISHLYTIVSRK